MSVNENPANWRLRTAGGIPYKLKNMEGSFAIEGSAAVETYIIRASDLEAFAIESFPYTVSFGGYVVFARERSMPGFDRLYSKTVKYKGLTEGRPIDPFGTDPSAPDGTYEQFLEVSIDYSPSDKPDGDQDQDDPQTFLEISSTASTNFLADTISSKGANWVSKVVGGFDVEEWKVDIDVPASVIETSIEWSFKWPIVPYQYFSDTLVARFRAALGKVNNGPTALFHNAPAETILFLGYAINQTKVWRRDSGVTVPPMSIDFKFLEKSFLDVDGEQVTHNHFYRPGYGWRRLLINSSPIFSQTNLDSIFQR